MVRRVSEGQQLDIEFENRERVTEDEYLEMIEGKTAVMFHICAELAPVLQEQMKTLSMSCGLGSVTWSLFPTDGRLD